MKNKIIILLTVISVLMMSSCRYVREWDELRIFHPSADTTGWGNVDSCLATADKTTLVYDKGTFFYDKFEHDDDIYLPYGLYYVIMYEEDSMVCVGDTLYYNQVSATVRSLGRSSGMVYNLNNYFYSGFGIWEIAPYGSSLQKIAWNRCGVKVSIRIQMEEGVEASIKNVRASLSGIAAKVRMYDGLVVENDGGNTVEMRVQENEDGSVLLTAIVFGFATDSYGNYLTNRLRFSFGWNEKDLFYSGYDDLEMLAAQVKDGCMDTTLVMTVENLSMTGSFVPWIEEEGHSFYDQDVK